MGKASRDKGKRGEREARDFVRDAWLCPQCQRSAQVSGLFNSDLMYGPPGLHLEVKRYARIVALDFLKQAEEDSALQDGGIPIVLMREDGGDWAVLLRAEKAVDFARTLRDHMEQQEDEVS